MHLQRIKSCVRCLCMANCLHKLSNLYSPFLTGSLSVLFECFLRHVHTFYGTIVQCFLSLCSGCVSNILRLSVCVCKREWVRMWECLILYLNHYRLWFYWSDVSVSIIQGCQLQTSSSVYWCCISDVSYEVSWSGPFTSLTKATVSSFLILYITSAVTIVLWADDL